uniref:Choline kinase N-terminal domain-containing protein n=1 Tax=Araucaria cunninghamii TaxID=56994 RepID=A0A0D6R8Q4_ARACU
MSGGDDIPEEAYFLLHQLASQWDGVADTKEIILKPLNGSMTNRVYECHWRWREDNAPKKVLVRIYGHGAKLLFDRESEVRAFERMSQLGQGPRLLGRFPSGRLEEFLNARTLSAPDLRDPNISQKIAVKLHEFHNLDIEGSSHPRLWERLSDWLENSRRLSKPGIIEEFQLNGLQAEITKLKTAISKPGERVGFCHNDLQYGNIMIDEKDGNITLIDYEYATYNPVAFDIANHFCEMMADYHTETPHLLHQKKYPDFAERQRFVECYLKASGNEDDCEVEKLIKDIDHYVLASHIHWGLWGILSANVAEIDFDYLGYARERFKLYYQHCFWNEQA